MSSGVPTGRPGAGGATRRPTTSFTTMTSGAARCMTMSASSRSCVSKAFRADCRGSRFFVSARGFALRSQGSTQRWSLRSTGRHRSSPRGRRHRSSSRQDRGDDQQRSALHRSAGSRGDARPPRLVVRPGGSAPRAPGEHVWDSCHEPGVDRSVEGPAQAGLEVRRADNCLRVHAVDGPHERSPRWLLASRRPDATADELIVEAVGSPSMLCRPSPSRAATRGISWRGRGKAVGRHLRTSAQPGGLLFDDASMIGHEEFQAGVRTRSRPFVRLAGAATRSTRSRPRLASASRRLWRRRCTSGSCGPR